MIDRDQDDIVEQVKQAQLDLQELSRSNTLAVTLLS